MIEYKIKDPAFFVRSVKSIGTVIDETLLQFGSRLRSYGLDQSHICLYELIIGESELEIISDGKIDIMIDIRDLVKIMNRFSSPDEMSISYDSERIIIKGRIDNKTKTFKLATLDSDIPPDPMETLNKLELDSVFNINLSDFMDMISDAEIYSDAFTMETIDDKLVIEALGNTGSVMSELELDNAITSIEKCTYSISLIHNILKTLGSQDVIISFAKDKPIMIYNKLAKDSHLKWFVGPRVEQDG